MRTEAGTAGRLASQLAALHSRLARREASEAELERLEEQLQQSQRLETLGRLTASVAHDFNNLLFVILGSGELALSRVDSGDPLHEHISEIVSAAEEASSLVSQLLTFSRGQALRPQALDINQVITEAKSMLCRTVGENIEVAIDLVPDAGCVKAAPGQIQQILMNLAANARDAMPDGGKLTIQTSTINEDKALGAPPSDQAPGQRVLLTVADAGPGIDEETRAHIFEPFFTTKAARGGAGLGLATVASIVGQCGGTIAVHSGPGRGTTFSICLPKVEEDQPAAQDRRDFERRNSDLST